MIIESFSIAYFPVEDRLLLQARGEDANQNFWITRRAAGMLNQAIQAVLTQIYELSGIRKEHLPLAQSFGQQHADQTLTPYTDQLAAPQSNPLLLFRIDYGPVDQGHAQLVLLNETGTGHAFRLNEEMLHAINNLLLQQCTLADWGLNLKTASVTLAEKSIPTVLLH